MYVMDTSMAGCAAETFTFHSYKSAHTDCNLISPLEGVAYDYDYEY